MRFFTRLSEITVVVLITAAGLYSFNIAQGSGIFTKQNSQPSTSELEDILAHTEELSEAIIIEERPQPDDLSIGVKLEQKGEEDTFEENIVTETFKEETEEGMTIEEFLLGQYDPTTTPTMVAVDSSYNAKPNRVHYLHTEAADAYVAMADAAKADGINLPLISSMRTFSHQKALWNKKWNNYTYLSSNKEKTRAVLQYTAAPGASRHHWGTEIDISGLSNWYFEHGNGQKTYDWMQANAHKYGFCQVYDDKTFNGRTGHREEKWHWSYIPLSSKFIKQYREHIGYEHLTNYTGSNTLEKLNVIEEYAFGVSDCKVIENKEEETQVEE